MRVNYNELREVLKTLQGVFDKNESDGIKDIHFSDGYAMSQGALRMIKVKLNHEGEFLNFSLKIADLEKALAGFANAFYTVVEYVEFELLDNAVKMLVKEVAIEEENSRFNNESTFVLNNVAQISKIIDNFNREVPENEGELTEEDFNIYSKTLVPLVSAGTGIQGKLNFGEEYVYFISSTINAFVKNTLPTQMTGIEINFNGLSLIKRLFELNEVYNVSQVEGYLVLWTEDKSVVSFIRSNKVAIDPQTIINGFSKDNGVVVDRRYFKEVLTRINNIGETNASLKIENDWMHVISAKFKQEMPLVAQKGEVEGLSFNVNSILEKTLLGADDVMAPEVRLYFREQGRMYNVYVTDSSGAWFTVMSTVKGR